MRCRQIKNDEIIWFGSAGLDLTQPVYNNKGEQIGYKSLKADNFVDKQTAVASSLTQRLSIIRTELWYNMSYGLPLFEKVKSKVFMDSAVTDIIMSHPDVLRIEKFESHIKSRKYTCKSQIVSKYGNLTFEI